MDNPNKENTAMSALIADLEHQTATLIALKAKKGPSTLEAKEREKFDAFLQGMMTDLAPIGTHETFLANSIAEEAWRLNQIRARCANLAAVGDFDGAGDNYRPMEDQNPSLETAVIDAVVARDHSKELALMSLYSQRTQRAYEKYRKELHELQAQRKADEAAQLE